ncbi:MAG TPA: hypothetical protein ENN72_03550 [Firmicutes bacterium]|nr:hypothetical protein [Bacillota bacterium]
MKTKKIMIILWALLFCLPVAAEERAPLANFELKDTPNNAGEQVEFLFVPAASPEEVPEFLLHIAIGDEPVKERRLVNAGKEIFLPLITGEAGVPVEVRVEAVMDDGSLKNLGTSSLVSRGEWLNMNSMKAFILGLLFIALIIFYVGRAKKGKDLFIRKIPGLEAIDDALGRATEMGRPVFYVPGTSSMADVATLASLNILRPVARQVAKYETPFSVPVKDPIVVSVAQDVVKEAYMAAGRPDLYDDGIAYLASMGQFDYSGAVSGSMMREKPATVFLLGMFYAESLILAETANSVGAIQIAGTDASSQLPFFIAACDYTLIGEELYAASAYMSREPLLLGTLKAQDILKGLLLLLFVTAIIFQLFGIDFVMDTFLKPEW